MNYEQIEQDYPKAYGVFKQSKYYRINEPDGYLLFDDRDLYDFFDEQEHFIQVYKSARKWYWHIDDGNEVIGAWEHHEKSRTEAEACAFYAAFKLLEETL